MQSPPKGKIAGSTPAEGAITVIFQMNLLILEPHQFIDPYSANSSVRQTQHILKTLKLASGDKLRVGKLNGKIGQARVTVDDDKVLLTDITLDSEAEPSLPITLILGLPRPQMIKRILQCVASIGIEELIFIHTKRVEKSFWQSPVLFDDAVHEHLLLGLEQGKGTQLPRVTLYKSFWECLESVLPEKTAGKHRYIAHPTNQTERIHLRATEPSALAIGPEGGFLHEELAQLEGLGFTRIGLGKRILKVETAIPALIGKLYL